MQVSFLFIPFSFLVTFYLLKKRIASQCGRSSKVAKTATSKLPAIDVVTSIEGTILVISFRGNILI